MGSKYSTILFAMPSFTEGAARVLDFGDTLTEYNRSPNPDAIAFAADWNAVIDDLTLAFAKVSKEIEKPRQLELAW